METSGCRERCFHRSALSSWTGDLFRWVATLEIWRIRQRASVARYQIAERSVAGTNEGARQKKMPGIDDPRHSGKLKDKVDSYLAPAAEDQREPEEAKEAGARFRDGTKCGAPEAGLVDLLNFGEREGAIPHA